MDNETKEYLRNLYNWLYAEFYDEHRTCKPPPLPPPPTIVDKSFSDYLITDIANAYLTDYTLYVTEGVGYILFEFMENRFNKGIVEKFSLICYDDIDYAKEDSTVENDDINELIEALKESAYLWRKIFYNFAKKVNSKILLIYKRRK